LPNYNDLVKQIKLRDDQAFAILYEDTRYSVYSIIYAIVKNRQVTEDLMQDTYMKMLQKIHQYNGEVQFKTWLLTIAKNLAIDHFRRSSKSVSIDIQDQEYLLPHHDDFVEKKMESELFLSVLNDEERQIVLLKVVDGMKHHEIAKLLEKPTGTIMWIYNKAIKKMQKLGKEE